MRIRIGDLRSLIRELGPHVIYDQFFVSDILPDLLQRSEDYDIEWGSIDPTKIGRFIDGGAEALVYEYGSDRVVRFQPTYEDSDERVEEVLFRQQSAPSGGLYVNVFEAGKIRGWDDDRDDV